MQTCAQPPLQKYVFRNSAQKILKADINVFRFCLILLDFFIFLWSILHRMVKSLQNNESDFNHFLYKKLIESWKVIDFNYFVF